MKSEVVIDVDHVTVRFNLATEPGGMHQGVCY